MIQLRGISKTYNNQQILKHVSLEWPQGKTHVLLGMSGSGKSTLLKIMLGLVPADSGEAVIDDLLVKPASQRQVAQKVGYVTQEGGLFPHLTAFKNVSLPARLAGINKEEIKTRIGVLADMVGLPIGLLAGYPQNLSGGQRQRVALMRALMMDPSVLILDEPLGALDPMVRSSLQDELKKLFASLQKTVVLVTHDIAEAAFFGDTITLLNAGSVIQTGSLDDLLKRPADPFVTDFIRAQRQPRELLDV